MLARFVVPLVLLALLAAIHAQLWTGRGSLQHVKELRQRTTAQRQANIQAQQDNERLASEVKDLQEGLEMVEEKARYELGMVKQGEIFIHVTAGSGK